MEYNDKLEYIGELEEIVRKQKEIIDNIHQYWFYRALFWLSMESAHVRLVILIVI